MRRWLLLARMTTTAAIMADRTIMNACPPLLRRAMALLSLAASSSFGSSDAASAPSTSISSIMSSAAAAAAAAFYTPSQPTGPTSPRRRPRHRGTAHVGVVVRALSSLRASRAEGNMGGIVIIIVRRRRVRCPRWRNPRHRTPPQRWRDCRIL